MYHLRKAGGTSLRQLLLQHYGGYSEVFNALEGWTLTDEWRSKFLDTSYSITSLRNPLDRIRSSYKYAGRWPQKAEVRSTDNVKSFRHWIDEVAGYKPNKYLWKCVENYYIKSLIGYPIAGEKGIGEEELSQAKNVLRAFNMVLIIEELSSAGTAKLLSRELAITEVVPHTAFPTAAKSPVENDSDLFDAPTIDWLIEVNELDFKLYDYARSLYLQRLEVLY